MTTDPTPLQAFLAVSAELTGFDTGTLLATGLDERYHALVQRDLGDEGLADPAQAEALIRLWYLGVWNDAVVDPEAYREGLLWRAVGTNPPGSRPPGYGTWALEPPLRQALARGLASLLLVLALLLGAADGVLAAAPGDLARLAQANSCSRCDLTAADLAGRDLYGVAISASDLSGADLSGSLLNDARLVQSTLVEADLHDAFLTGADLSGSVLSRADLRAAHLASTILRGTVLRDAQLDGADLTSADLRQALLGGAHLMGARLAGSSLQRADLRAADLQNADLRHADLREAQLDGALLCGADLQQALLPDGRRADGPPQAC